MKKQTMDNSCKTIPQAVLDSAIDVTKKAYLVPRRLGFDLGLFDPVTQEVYILNATAAAIWENIYASRSYWDVSSGLALSYDLDTEAAKDIAGDVHSIVARWKKDGLFQTDSKLVGLDDNPREHPRIPFPERDVSRVTSEYQRPTYSKYTVETLRERHGLEEFAVKTPFADVWL